MEPNPYEAPKESETDQLYEPPWAGEAEKAVRKKKWARGCGIAALVVFLTPLIGYLTVAAMGVVDLLIYIVYRLVTGNTGK